MYSSLDKLLRAYIELFEHDLRVYEIDESMWECVPEKHSTQTDDDWYLIYNQRQILRMLVKFGAELLSPYLSVEQ